MAKPKTIRQTLPRFARLVHHFAPALRKQRRLMSGAMTVLFVGVFLQLLEPWPLKFILDRIIPMQRPEGLAVIPVLENLEPTTLLTLAAVAIVAIVSLRAVCDYYRSVGFALLGNRVTGELRGDLYRHIQALSLSFHTKSRAGDLLVRVIGDIKLLRDVAISALLPLLASLVILLGMVAVMFFLNWRLALLAVAIVPLFALSTVRIGGRIHEAARKQRQREGEMAATASESIAAVKVVQALSMENHFGSAFDSQNQRSLADGVKTRRLAAQLERTADVLIAIATATVLWFGAKFVMRGELTPGDLIVFVTYLKRGFRPLQDLAKYAGRIAKATAAGERVVELLETCPDIQDAPDAVDAPELAGRITLEDLTFSYESHRNVLANINLNVPAGTTLAVVGSSGAGKSTILNLLLRLYDPTDGRILMDGVDIRDWTLNSLRGQVSVVMQDTILFAANVWDNIAYAAPDASREDLTAAAQLANAHDFIMAMPNGYDSLLGERGVNLSHGQRQRIAIARAAVRRAPILLLDEPTTGLDEENAKAVREALLRLARQQTTILVTHDLSEARHADTIAYLEGGQVIEHGSHRQLMTLAGRYAELYDLQTNGTCSPDRREVPI